jgi:putative membrane protein
MMFFGGLFWVFLLVLVAVIAVRLVRGWGRDGGRRSAGLAILEERYAKGEIQRDEYLQKKSDFGF